MNNKFFITLVLSISLSILSDQESIIEQVSKILPADSEIESVQQTDFPGIYKVYYGEVKPLYVSSDGNYFIFGDMYKISKSGLTNLTEIDLNKNRASLLNQINSMELISFLSDDELYSITVFTDVDCGYCRKLHDEIKNYNALGISVHYAAYPRSGIGTETFTKMVSAWCSKNPKEALTKLKKGRKIDLEFCESQPVAKHYALGKKLGISGTPSLFSTDGRLFPGYSSPEDLLIKLKD